MVLSPVSIARRLGDCWAYQMVTFLLTAIVIMLALGLVGYLSGRRSDHMSPGGHVLLLLPGDIKYESPSGKFRFYFPITTSIVIGVLTLVLWLLS